jgi:hypothetical protein
MPVQNMYNFVHDYKVMIHSRDGFEKIHILCSGKYGKWKYKLVSWMWVLFTKF